MQLHDACAHFWSVVRLDSCMVALLVLCGYGTAPLAMAAVSRVLSDSTLPSASVFRLLARQVQRALAPEATGCK